MESRGEARRIGGSAKSFATALCQNTSPKMLAARNVRRVSGSSASRRACTIASTVAGKRVAAPFGDRANQLLEIERVARGTRHDPIDDVIGARSASTSRTRLALARSGKSPSST